MGARSISVDHTPAVGFRAGLDIPPTRQSARTEAHLQVSKMSANMPPPPIRYLFGAAGSLSHLLLALILLFSISTCLAHVIVSEMR